MAAANESLPAPIEVSPPVPRVETDSDAPIAPTVAPAEASARPRPWFAILCLFGAICFALFGQYSFTDDKRWIQGIIAYVAAIALFVLMVLSVERANAGKGYSNRYFDWLEARVMRMPVRLVCVIVATLGAFLATQTASTKAWDQDQNSNIALWLASILIFIAGFVPWTQFIAWLRAPKKLAFVNLEEFARTHRLELILVVGIVAVAFVARYWHLAWVPPIFGGDEGEMGNEALNILRGDLKNPFITGWLSHPTLFFFLIAGTLRVFGATVYGVRMLPMLGGTLSVLVAYFLVKRMFSTRLALLTAALLAAYHFHIHYSRLALNNIFDAVFAPLMLLLFYAGIETRRASLFALAGVVMGLAQYFYPGTRLLPVIIAVFAVYLLLLHRSDLFPNLKNFVWLGLGTLVVGGPLFYFFYTHPNDFMARVTQRGIFQSGWFEKQVEQGQQPAFIFLEQIRRSFLAFNVIPDPSGWYSTGQPLLDPLSGMLFIFGIVLALMQLRQKNYVLMLLWLVLGVFFGSTLLENPPTSPSFVIVTIPALFFVALALERLVEIAARLLTPLARVRVYVMAGFVILFGIWSLVFYFVDYAPKYTYGGEPNWVAREMADYLQTRSDRYRVYFVAPPYIYLGIGSLKFIMPQINGQDVLEPIRSPDDLNFVNQNRTALFVFVPARANEFEIVRRAYPNGVRRDFNKPNGSSLFFIWEVKLPNN